MVEWDITSAFNINICIWFDNFPKKEDDRRNRNTERLKEDKIFLRITYQGTLFSGRKVIFTFYPILYILVEL